MYLEDFIGYDDNQGGVSGEGVHCARLHEVVCSTVSWQIGGFHQFNALAYTGGTLQVLQFILVGLLNVLGLHLKLMFGNVNDYCRAILSTLTVEEINGDRIKFAKLVSEMASPDLGR